MRGTARFFAFTVLLMALDLLRSALTNYTLSTAVGLAMATSALLVAIAAIDLWKTA